MEETSVEMVLIRQQVCTACDRKSAGSESLAPTESRECETGCDLFRYLPRIARVIRQCGGEPPCGYESALQSLACTECAAPELDCESPCPRPLRRFGAEAAALIELAVRPRRMQP
jgi:hypothetical protein